jgi:hypothetical protein
VAPEGADVYDGEDAEPLAGVNYYRIVCDIPSGEWRSRIVMVNRPAGVGGPVIAPNPFRGSFGIRMPRGEHVQDVSVTDATGEQLLHVRPAGGEMNMTISGDHLPAGWYMVRVVTQKAIYLQRVLKR